MTIGRLTQDDQTDMHNNSDELTDNDDNTLTGVSASQLASDDRVQTNDRANDETSGAESVVSDFQLNPRQGKQPTSPKRKLKVKVTIRPIQIGLRLPTPTK